MVEQKQQQPNSDLSILHKVLHKIKPHTILCIQVVPEYVEAILKSEQPYTDIGIYNTIKSAYMKLLVNGNGTYKTFRVLKRVSRDVFGDDNIWKKEIDTSELFFTKGLEKINEILAIRISNIPDFVSALHNHTSTIYTDDNVYNILKSVCITKKLNDELSLDELKVMNGVSKAITGSPITWKKEGNKNG